jgi:putative exporter of polyketide antibiotics
MNAAQVAWACLTALFLAAGTVLYLLDAQVAGSIMFAVAVLGYLMLTGMITNDARTRTGRTPS